MGKAKSGRPYREVWEMLDELNMTVWELTEEIERKSGRFIDYRKLRRRLKTGQKIGYWIYCAVYEAIGLSPKETGGNVNGKRNDD